MIQVNGCDLPWKPGMTVQQVIQAKGYTFPAVMVSVNGISVAEEEYETYGVQDGDTVLVLHLIAGG